VRVRQQTAFLRQGAWRSADLHLESRLNDLTKKWIQETGGPPVNDRNHEITTAKKMVKLVGGRICRHVPPAAKQSARIYISQRQLDLDFSGSAGMPTPSVGDADPGSI